ncbi:MAG: hypothetical protein RL552_729, partial [Actinomycetota bacterium]
TSATNNTTVGHAKSPVYLVAISRSLDTVTCSD